MGRKFNTAGPCNPVDDYMLPPLQRLPEVPRLVEQKGYFVVHAPRQTGKTTTIRAFAEQLTDTGDYVALAFSCEGASAVGEDYAQAERVVLHSIRENAQLRLPAELRPPQWPDAPAGSLLGAGLTKWAVECPRPLVLFFDEIDSLLGPSLISVLRQLRAGYNNRPSGFPSSVVLCGLKDVRDYKAASGGDPSRLGTASPFNIKLKSLRLGDFTPDEVRELYGEHTAETGQEFEVDALDCAYELSAGQPWLVNALAREVIEEMDVPATEPITVAHFAEAKERLIKARATHLDSLASKLHQPRVRRVMTPMIAGTVMPVDPEYDDDVSYLRDLGLIAADAPLRVANPIYREVVLRILGANTADSIIADPRSFVTAAGRLDFEKLLVEFTEFWKEHGDVLTNDKGYHEVAPQLVLMSYLQRLVNGGGYVDREYGVGRGRIDLLIRWPFIDESGQRRLQREAVELKAWHPGRPDPLAQGLEQLDGYLDRLDLTTGVLAVFDRRAEAKPIPDRTSLSSVISPRGRAVTLLRA